MWVCCPWARSRGSSSLRNNCKQISTVDVALVKEGYVRTISDNPRHANHPMRFHALQRVQQRRRANQFENFVHSSPTLSLSLDFRGDIPIIDNHATGSAVFQQLRSRIAAARRGG